MAKKTVWDIALEINGKDSGASKSLLNLQKQMKNVQAAGKQLSGDFKNFTGNATKLALGVVGGVAAATAGVVSMANSFAAAGDKVAKTSAAIGIGIEAYQGLQFAMGQSGLSAEEFDAALNKFNLTVRQGAAGNEAAAKQLQEIGLSAKKLAGMKPEQAIERLSDYMQALPNDAERTRAAVTLFGKAAGPKMMAAMKQGSAGLQQLMDEAKSLGIVMTEEQAHQSEAYTDAITRLNKSVNGMKNQFIGSAIGPLTQAFDHLKDAIVEQMPAIQELGQKFGVWLGETVKRLPEIIAKVKEFGTWIKETANRVAGFVGGWQNLAKIVAMLAIAPTFISGLKVVISLFGVLKAVVGLASGIMGLFGTTAAASGAAGATGFGALAAAVWAVTWPVLAVIAAIAAVIAIIVLVVKNFDKIKEVAGTVWDAVCGFVSSAVDFIKNIFGGIGDFFSGVWGGIKNAAGTAWDGIKNVAGKAWEGIKGGASKAGEFLKNNWKTIAIGMVSPMAGGLKALYDHNEKFRNFVDTTWGKIKDFAENAWEGIKGAASNALEGMKNAGGMAADFFKNRWSDIKEAGGQAFTFIDNFSGGALTRIKDNFLNSVNNIKAFFTGLWGAIKEGPSATIEFLKNTFFGLFDSIKQKIETFVNFFKEKMEAVKNFFGGIGDKVGGLVGGAVDKFRSIIPGHAEGGIFTHRHIAEIAERGAEAVVPLNNSPNGFDIWKQAGEIGGYAGRISQQTATASTSGTPPVMQAAAQRISGGENVININFSQNNTFNGGTQDKETVNQISAAGQQAADDFEVRVKQALDNIMRNQRRVSCA
jgi:phage-related protein